jgi:anti-sigma factor RsiW
VTPNAVAGLAAAAVVVLAVWLWPEQSFVAEASRHASRADSGALALDLATPDPAALERHLADRGRPVRVLDLAMMDLTLTGGSVVSVDGRPAAFYVYRRSDGARVVCLMFPGRLDELPPPRATIAHNGFQFQVYHRGRRTLVFWAEGDTLCVLASDLPESEVIELAKGKAMRPT